MKKFIAFILSLFLLLCLASCEEKTPAGTGGKKEFTYGSDGITKIYTDESGRTVKTEDAFYKTVYEYGENGLLSKHSTYSAGDTEPFEYYVFEYDEACALTKKSYFHTEKLREYTVYESGDGGKPQKATLYGRTNAFSEDFAVQRTTVYEYDAAGLLAKEQNYDESGAPAETFIYEYHASGKTKTVLPYFGERLRKTAVYDENGNITLEEADSHKSVYEYGKEGKLISEHIYRFSPSKSESLHTYTYDKDGRRTAEELRDTYGGETTVTKYTLHSNGRYAEAKQYASGGALLKHTLYNANGVNADKEIYYNSDGTKARMVEYNGATVIKITLYHADGTVSTAIP